MITGRLRRRWRGQAARSPATPLALLARLQCHQSRPDPHLRPPPSALPSALPDPRLRPPRPLPSALLDPCLCPPADLRLQLLDVKSNPYLIKALYGLLMLLPQSSAFQLLSHRLQCVPNPELLQTE